MGENTTIEWTDNTFNPWIGCTKVSPGCANCYAERDWDKRRRVVQWGPVGTRVVTSEENWRKPLRWNKHAEVSGTRTRVFCASLADVFEDWPGGMRNSAGVELWSRGDGYWSEAPGPSQNIDAITGGYRAIKMTDVRQRLFALIDQTPHLDWQLVTKRPENIRLMWPGFAGHRKNVWLLTSVENQEQADQRIPELLKCRDLAPVLGLSCEPLLGPVDLRAWMHGEMDCDCCRGDGYYTVGGVALDCEECNGTGGFDGDSCLDWVIAGGESGPGARPVHPDWVRSLQDQCVDSRAPFFFKQWGEFCAPEQMDEHLFRQWAAACGGVVRTGGDREPIRVGKNAAGRLLDGIEWNGFPRD